MEKRRNCLDFNVYVGNRFSLRDKRLFEISEVEIARINCKFISQHNDETKMRARLHTENQCKRTSFIE